MERMTWQQSLRVGLGCTLIPMGLLAIFLLGYVLSYPAEWVANASFSEKLVAASTVCLALAMGFILLRRGLLDRFPEMGAFVLLLAVAELVYLMPSIYASLGRF